MVTSLAALVRGQEHVNEKEDLYPHLSELIVGFVAFAVLFFFVSKWVLPRVGKLLDERREKIQGNLAKAEQARQEAQSILSRYEEQLQKARGESTRIIEEARKTADSMRKDLLEKAEEEARQVVGRAQEEIRAERARAVEELRRSVGVLSVELASRVIGETLDQRRHSKLVDQYIDELATLGDGNGNGSDAGKGGGGS